MKAILPCSLIFQLLIATFFLTSFSGPPHVQSQVLLSAWEELPGYQKLQADWNNEFNQQKKALGIRFSCGGYQACEGSYIELSLTVNAEGKTEKYDILGERFCLNSKGEKLRANLLLFISHYTYPPDLYGKTITIRTGLSLKC